MPRNKFPETITYWAPAETNEYNVASYETPVALKGRWEDTVELFTTPAGEEQQSSAIAYLDHDVVPNGYLARGDFSDQVDPHQVGSFEIRQVSRVRNIRYSDSEIKVFM